LNIQEITWLFYCKFALVILGYDIIREVFNTMKSQIKTDQMLNFGWTLSFC